MPTATEPVTLLDRGWIIRRQPPRDATAGPARSLLLLHGWTGDETVMWIFARKVPDNTWIFAPRGPVQAPSGYGWLPRDGNWYDLKTFQTAAEQLMEAFRHWSADARAPQTALDVMGFSQGAAMAYALAAYFPQQVARVAALAGFLPADSAGAYDALHGKPVFIAHGTQDRTVSIQKAREAAQILQNSGAHVTYCESETGHKLGAACLRGLEAFLA